MATTLQVTPQLRLSSLVDMHQSTFQHAYQDGLVASLFNEHEDQSPLHDLYLSDIFTLARRFGYFQARCEQRLAAHVGFAVGEIHGGVLLPDGTIQPGVTSLVRLCDLDLTRGYYAGRHYVFVEAETDQQRTLTEVQVLDRFHEFAEEYDTYEEAEKVLRFSIGGILGSLSMPLFPWTREEQARLEQDSLELLGYVEPLPKHCLAYKIILQPA